MSKSSGHLDRFVARSNVDASADELGAWHLRPGAFDRLKPPWETIEVLSRAERLIEGARVELRVPFGPLRLGWTAVHRDFEAGRQFRDIQERGPFAHWCHTHRFRPESGASSVLEDDIEYALPLGPLGRWFGAATVRNKLQRTFTYRHAITRGDLRRHARCPETLRVAISGAGGLVGSALTAFLTSGGHEVLRLVRRASADPSEIGYDPESGAIETDRLEGLDAVVHLAGAGIADGRWTARRKKIILDSRVDGTRTIAVALSALERPPRVLVNASAIGFYGDRGDETLDETSPAGTGFLARTCQAWENAVAPAEAAGVRVVRLRIGMVVAAAGGALRSMLLPFRLGLGGRLGSGEQYMSWIALDDLVGVIHRCLHSESLAGAVNAVGPNALTNAAFTRELGAALSRPAVLPVPAAAVRLLLGDMGRELLLAGARVVPGKLQAAGFEFLHEDLARALRFELGRFDPHDGSTVPEFSG